MRQRSVAAAVAVSLAFAIPVALGGCGGDSDSDNAPVATGTEAAPSSEATRDALAQTAHVQGAPGRTLGLSRVEIPPGVKLDLHHHLGTQVSRVESGVLTYTVQEGSVVVRRGPSDGQSTVVRRIRAGQTGTIRAGQWLVEQPSDIHSAVNRGTEPIVVYLSTLLKTDAPAATPVAPGG